MYILYKGLYVPIIIYTAAGWADKLNVHHRSRLYSSQRNALLKASRICRIVSNDALTVICASVPIDIVLTQKTAYYHLRRNQSFTIGNYKYIELQETSNAEDTKQIRNQIRKKAIEIWQTRWQNSSKGRITYKFFSTVHDGLENSWPELNFHTI